ncbi:MAG: HD domain-containing protein [Planctomycetes bacterium]|nr:HD domain-containing protein [Planctomycetota bacterium]
MSSPSTSPLAADLRLGEVVGALSYALDLTEGQPPGHSLRCCYLGMQLAGPLGLDDAEATDLYYTLLLKDAGCSSNAARLCELYGADDRTTKRDVKTVDLQSVKQLGRFVLSHTGLKKGLWTRFKLLLNLLRNGEQLATEVVQARCERGAAIAMQLGFSRRVAAGIQSLDEHHNGKGRPRGIAGDDIPLLSRIALLAQVADVFHQVGGADAALAELRRRSGTWFDPALVDLFCDVAAAPAMWQGLAAPDLEASVMALEPTSTREPLTEARMDAIARGFGQVIDAKSPYTSGHSGRVADYCEAIGARLGLGAVRLRWLRRAGMLHDIGKLGVSNTILDKPGKLDDAEWNEMRGHAAHTHAILSRITPLRELATVAGAHHERLDGGGYPWGLQHEQIPLETRIITVADIWDAISADRPYRAGMPLNKALQVMQDLVGGAIDPDVHRALLDALPQVGGRADVESVQSLLASERQLTSA